MTYTPSVDHNLRYTSDAIQWRRNKVLELSAQGNDLHDIARILHIGYGTAQHDIEAIKYSCQDQIKNYIEKRIPIETEQCLTGINLILKRAWETVNTTQDDKVRLVAFGLIKETYGMKTEVLTNINVVEDAMTFVIQHKPSHSRFHSWGRPAADRQIITVESEPERQQQQGNNSNNTYPLYH